MIYVVIVLACLCTGLIGYIVGGGMKKTEPAVDTRTDKEKEHEKDFAEHFNGMMNYSADQAYKVVAK